TRLFEDYLKGRPTLRRLCLLIDSRHGAKDGDRTLMGLMDEAAVSYQIVLTKADLTPADELDARRAALLDELAGHAAAHPEIMAASARTGAGIAGLRAALAALAAPERFD
ncbi:MAG: YihA family ribosome biogenesis GTP-binding protein, partial [Dongiaceae bacterium]